MRLVELDPIYKNNILRRAVLKPYSVCQLWEQVNLIQSQNTRIELRSRLPKTQLFMILILRFKSRVDMIDFL